MMVVEAVRKGHVSDVTAMPILKIRASSELTTSLTRLMLEQPFSSP